MPSVPWHTLTLGLSVWLPLTNKSKHSKVETGVCMHVGFACSWRIWTLQLPHGKGTGLPHTVRSGEQSQHFSLIVLHLRDPRDPSCRKEDPEKSEEEEAALLSADSGDAVLPGHQVGGTVAGRWARSAPWGMPWLLQDTSSPEVSPSSGSILLAIFPLDRLPCGPKTPASDRYIDPLLNHPQLRQLWETCVVFYVSGGTRIVITPGSTKNSWRRRETLSQNTKEREKNRLRLMSEGPEFGL